MPAFPAAATTSAPAFVALMIALCSVVSGSGPPRLKLMILAPVAACTVPLFPLSAGRPAAYRMPWAMS